MQARSRVQVQGARRAPEAAQDGATPSRAPASLGPGLPRRPGHPSSKCGSGGSKAALAGRAAACPLRAGPQSERTQCLGLHPQTILSAFRIHRKRIAPSAPAQRLLLPAELVRRVQSAADLREPSATLGLSLSSQGCSPLLAVTGLLSGTVLRSHLGASATEPPLTRPPPEPVVNVSRGLLGAGHVKPSLPTAGFQTHAGAGRRAGGKCGVTPGAGRGRVGSTRRPTQGGCRCVHPGWGPRPRLGRRVPGKL